MRRAVLLFVLTMGITGTVFSLDMDEAREVVALLHGIDELSTRFGERIISISDEFNFGIPGGTNWLVEWEIPVGKRHFMGGATRNFIYVVDIDTREIPFRQSVAGGPDAFPQYFENLPGRTFANSRIGDFNGEGFDMILDLFGNPIGSRTSLAFFRAKAG